MGKKKLLHDAVRAKSSADAGGGAAPLSEESSEPPVLYVKFKPPSVTNDIGEKSDARKVITELNIFSKTRSGWEDYDYINNRAWLECEQEAVRDEVAARLISVIPPKSSSGSTFLPKIATNSHSGRFFIQVKWPHLLIPYFPKFHTGIPLENLRRINVILGKNGCGKSTLLAALSDQQKQNHIYGSLLYPERGSRIDAETESSSFRDKLLESFKEIFSGELCKKNCAHRVIPLVPALMDSINRYLENIRLYIDILPPQTSEDTHQVMLALRSRRSPNNLEWDELSSGENEFITVWLRIVTFWLKNTMHSCSGKKHLGEKGQTWLLLDEPDLHLHPDAQHKLCDMIICIVSAINRNFKNQDRTGVLSVILATHSTTVLSALMACADPEMTPAVCFMQRDAERLTFQSLAEKRVTDTKKSEPPSLSKKLNDILPIFGAHPLSQIFNANPLFLVEGGDEERIWQQAVRTTKGVIKLYPREVGGEGNMSYYEATVNEILPSIYDNPLAYSLVDGDGVGRENDVPDYVPGKIKRFRLHCYAAENLLLSDDVLQNIVKKYGVHTTKNSKGKDIRTPLPITLSWSDVTQAVEEWLLEPSHKKHSRYECIQRFKASNFDRVGFNKVKDIVRLLLELMEEIINRKISEQLNKELNEDEKITVTAEWEVLVGQTIGQLTIGEINPIISNHSIFAYLGKDFVKIILPQMYARVLLNYPALSLLEHSLLSIQREWIVGRRRFQLRGNVVQPEELANLFAGIAPKYSGLLSKHGIFYQPPPTRSSAALAEEVVASTPGPG
jgi:hypothetical protein